MNNYKQCETIISDILDLKLGVGDIVADKRWLELEGYVLYITNDGLVKFKMLRDDSTCVLHKNLIKLKQRNITLPMALEAWYQSCKMDLEIELTEKELKEWTIDIFLEIYVDEIIKFMKLWQFRKDRKDLSLFDQKNETAKFIVEVLK